MALLIVTRDAIHFFVAQMWPSCLKRGMSGGVGQYTAILLAGQRPGENDFAQALGYPAKALIEIEGEPMLGRVARALLAAPSVGRIVVLAQEPERLLRGKLQWMAEEEQIGMAVGAAGISASILAFAGGDAAPWPVLVVTADHALLTPEIVETFLAAIPDKDVAVAVVERRVVEAAYPETRRTWLKFSDGAYTGANLFALRTANARRALEIWSNVEKDRKKVRRLLGFFGPMLALRAFTRTISLKGALATAGHRAGLSAAAIPLPIAEAAIDVDKLEDLQLVERIILKRRGQK
jgi:GTP:adenosylcobinamide-phosphate guanylyltransferase